MSSTAPPGAMDEVRRRAQKRWWIVLAVIAVLSGLGGYFGQDLFGGSRDHRHHSHPSVGAAIALIVIGVGVLAGAVVALVWMVRKVRGGEGMFASPLAGGLPWKQRRRVAKALRAGRPSDDHVLRTVEVEAARRIVRYRRLNQALFPLLFLSSLSEALFGNFSEAGRIYFAVLAALFVPLAIQQTVYFRRARRYLGAVGEPSQS